MEKTIDDKNLVIINSIKFRGKRKIDWDEVEVYLKKYIGHIYKIEETSDIIFIGTDFADEYSGSRDTARLKGTLAKEKANAAQGIPELIGKAINKRYKKNLTLKHNQDAKYGWFRYDSRFALPVYNDKNRIERYNVFRVELLVRHAEDGNCYLYDIVNIKKETSTPLKQ